MNRLHSSRGGNDRKEPAIPKEGIGQSEGRRWREEVAAIRNSIHNGPEAGNSRCVQGTDFSRHSIRVY